MAGEYPDKPVIRGLKKIEAKDAPTDFVQNLTDVNQKLEFVSKVLIVMQGGIDDANATIIDKIQDAINELIIIFTGGDDSGGAFDFDIIGAFIDNVSSFLGFNPSNVQPQQGGGIDLIGMAGNFIDSILKPTNKIPSKASVDDALQATVNLSNSLAGLQSRTQRLEGVVGYSNGYISGGWSGQTGLVKRPVDMTVGPVIGVIAGNGAFYLSSKGLWSINATMTANTAGFGVGSQLELQIRVYDPLGNLHFLTSNVQDTGPRCTMLVSSAFVVPTSGYYVELWSQVAIARDVLAGPAFSSVRLNKISTETS